MRWRRRRWWCISVAAVLLTSAHPSTPASLAGAENTNESESSPVELQITSEFSMIKRNTTVVKERESTSEESTDTHTETDIQKGTFKNSSINISNGQMNTFRQQRNGTHFNSSANVITLAEVKRRMEMEKIPTERFQPEVVENEIQRLLTFFNPARQDGGSEQRASMSLWEYLMNYVTGAAQPPSLQLSHSYRRVEKLPQHHPCEAVPGDYNQWFREARPLRVVVAGGGVAGLAALTTLAKLKVDDVLLLEATDRMGGRVKTIRHDKWVAEEGPNVIQGGSESPLYSIAQEKGVLGPPTDNALGGEFVVTSRGDSVPRTIMELHAGVQQRLHHSLNNGELEQYYGRSLGDFLSSRHHKLWGSTRDLSDRAASQHIIHQIINAKFGSWTWFNVSAHDADNLKLGHGHSWQGGMDALVHTLLDELSHGQVRMLSPVCRVYWDLPGGRHALVVSADGSSFLADHVLVMLPLGVLQEHHQSIFNPSLPTTLTRALMAVKSGSVNRLNLGWAVPWWGNKPFRMVIFWKDSYFPPEMDWVTNIVQVRSTDHHSAMLEITVAGEASLLMETLEPETIISHLITFLRATNKRSIVPLPLFFHRSKWCENIWARGSYQSYVIPGEGGLHLQDRSTLAVQLLNSKKKQSVIFGGEHTSTDHFGTVDGAFVSGVQAALRVAEQLQQGKRKNTEADTNCLKAKLMRYFSIRHPENVFQSMDCDDADPSDYQLSKERKKDKNKRKKDEHYEYLLQSPPQESKLVKSHELNKQPNLAVKGMNNPALNGDEIRDMHSSEETADIAVAYNNTNGKTAAYQPNYQKIMQTVNEKQVQEEQNYPNITMSYEDIIEKLIKRLSEPTKATDESEENHASSGSKVKQRKKHKDRRRWIRKKRRRQKHNKKHRSTRRKDISSSSTVPPTDLKHSVPTQSIVNEQKGETHLHFYLSEPKSVNPALTVQQNPETSNKEIPDLQQETIQLSILTDALKEERED